MGTIVYNERGKEKDSPNLPEIFELSWAERNPELPTILGATFHLAHWGVSPLY